METAPAQAFSVGESSATNNVLQFRADGTVYLSGDVIENASIGELTPQADQHEFIVRTGPDADNVVARFSPEEGGTLYLKGTVYPADANLTADPNLREFVVKANGVVQSLIDQNGNLKRRGSFWRLNEPLP